VQSLTKEIISSFNILTLAGFVVMMITLAPSRSGQTRKALSIGLMCAGTALVFFGLYAGAGRGRLLGWSPRRASTRRGPLRPVSR
jgi:hypothetical protein